MRSTNTQGIVLARTNYGEADRILTFLTPGQGKVKVIAKGVRKAKSKLAGGIELFSVSDIGYIVGRSEIYTLISSRLLKHYGNIVKDLDRTNLAYDCIKKLNKATEDSPEPFYFDLLKAAFESLDYNSIDLNLIEVWFSAQLLAQAGHSPNMRSQKSGEKLQANVKYNFDLDTMAFQPNISGKFGADQIKFMRLIFSDNQPGVLNKITGIDKLAKSNRSLIQVMLQNHIRI